MRGIMGTKSWMTVVAWFAALGAAVPTLAGTNTLAGLYGNTLISVDGGIETHFWYNSDHTFTGKIPAFYMVLKGTWSINAKGQVCRVFDPVPPTMTNPDCGPILVHTVGDHGSFPDGDSERVVAGVK